MAAKSPRCTRTPAALPCGYVMVRRAPLGPSAVEGVPGAGRLRMSGNQDAVRVHGVSGRSRVVPVAGERRFHHRTAACDCAASGRGQQTALGDRSFRCHRITVTVTVEAVCQCGPPAVLYDQARVPTVCVVVGGDAAKWPPLFTAMAIRTSSSLASTSPCAVDQRNAAWARLPSPSKVTPAGRLGQFESVTVDAVGMGVGTRNPGRHIQPRAMRWRRILRAGQQHAGICSGAVVE